MDKNQTCSSLNVWKSQNLLLEIFFFSTLITLETKIPHRSDASQNDHKSKGYLPVYDAHRQKLYILKVGDPGVKILQIIFIFRNFFGWEREKLSTLQQEKKGQQNPSII